MAKSTTSTPIEEASKLISSTQTQLKKLLGTGEYSHLWLGLDAHLTRMGNQLQHLSGQQFDAPVQEEYEPITNFMGEEIAYKDEIKVEDLDPEEAERAIFLDKVDRLYLQFDTIEPDGILNSHTTPEDVLVVRGVAKKAGVEGYEERELTIPFIEAISKAIKAKAQGDAKEKQMEEELQKQNKIVDLQERIKTATDKKAGLATELEEYTEKLKTATTDKEKKKVQEAITAITGEIGFAEELINGLDKELEDLGS